MHRLAWYLHHLSQGWQSEDGFAPLILLGISNQEATNSIKIFYDGRSHRLSLFVSMDCQSSDSDYIIPGRAVSSSKIESNKAAKYRGVCQSMTPRPPRVVSPTKLRQFATFIDGHDKLPSDSDSPLIWSTAVATGSQSGSLQQTLLL